MRSRARFTLLPAMLLLAAAAPDNGAARFAAFDRAVAGTKAAMMGDPGAALKRADAALALARTLPGSARARVAVATAQWLQGEAHLFLDQGDAAAPLIDTALATVQRDAPGTKLEGDLMRSKGAIAEASGRMQDALRAYQTAYAILTAAHEDRSRAMALQDIGRVYWSAGDYERTLRYYEQSAEVYSKDPVLLLTTQNSRGELLKKLGRLREAEANYRVALAAARAQGSGTLQERILTNLADTQIGLSELDAAGESIARALALAAGAGGQAWRPFVIGEAAKLADARGDARGAARLLDQVFGKVGADTDDNEFVDFHKLAAGVYEKAGQPDLALVHLKAFQRLDSKARALTASYGAQLASARFDFANQNARISTLKAQHLQQQVQLEHQRERTRTIVTAALVMLALGIFGFLSFALVTGRRSRDRLRRINTELESALKAKTEFLAMTSHEIRTPLNGILGMTQVMLSERSLEPQLRDRIRLVHGAGETMRALVDDILDVAKMETSEVAIVEEDADLGGLLDDLAALWGEQARAKGIALDCDHRGLPSWLRLDPARVRQVVFNLLSNAVKFTETGHIAVTARSEGEELLIAVQDSGIGIDPAQHELIFEPFQQADASTTRRFGGTGLGLAICRKLVQAMGGTISVESALGIGATFTLRLPLKQGQVETGPVPAERVPAATLAEARLLLVEANLVTQGVLGGLLEAQSGEVIAAASGDEALALIRGRSFDHLLVEAGSAAVTGKSGAEGLAGLLDQARALGMHTSVLASASSTVSIDEVQALSPDQIILKPIGGGALLGRLRELYQSAPARAAA